MTDKRRMAVSYGSFSCVIEGFDDPFTLMRDIISFYHQVSQEEPEFAHFHDIVDMQELKALLEQEMGDEIELEPIAGGVYARRIETPARLAGADAPQAPGDEALADGDGATTDDREDTADRHEDTADRQMQETAAAEEPEGDADTAPRHAAADGADGDAETEAADQIMEATTDEERVAQPAGHEFAAFAAEEEPTGRPTDAGEDDAEEDSGEGAAQPASGPTRLYDAPGADAGEDAAGDDDRDEDDEGRTMPEDGTAARDPLRLPPHAVQNPQEPAGAAQDAGDEATTTEPGRGRLTLGAALRLGPENAVPSDLDEDAAQEEDTEPAGAFIDRVAGKDETRDLLTSPQPLRRDPPAEEDPPVDVSIAQIRSDIEAVDETATPKKTGGLRMGSFLRRKSVAPSGEAGENPASGVGEPEHTAPDTAVPSNAGRAEKPRSLTGGMLRVIRSGEETPDAATEDAPAPQDERPAVPEPKPEPQMREAVDPEPPRADRGGSGNEDPLKSRLHASFGSMREPASAKEVIELDADELHDPHSPRGFAQRVGATSVPELMAAAAAFRLLIDGKTTVTRTDIMETVQMIMGDKPLSAEAKVKAFGKLVRGGELTRLDGGMFTLAPEQIESFQERFDAARTGSAAGG